MQQLSKQYTMTKTSKQSFMNITYTIQLCIFVQILQSSGLQGETIFTASQAEELDLEGVHVVLWLISLAEVDTEDITSVMQLSVQWSTANRAVSSTDC